MRLSLSQVQDHANRLRNTSHTYSLSLSLSGVNNIDWRLGYKHISFPTFLSLTIINYEIIKRNTGDIFFIWS